MKILKFGGTSVGSTEAIRLVAEILKDYHQRKEVYGVVVSAMKGVTNNLIECGQRAAKRDESYFELLKEIELQHFFTVEELFKVSNQSKINAHLKKRVNEIEELLHGISLLRELSLRTLDTLQSFGERMSSYLIAEFLTQEGIVAEQLDARDVVLTDKTFGSAKVDFIHTNNNIRAYFKNRTALQVITGFIAATADGDTSTLGRGGSDYTAAIFGAALEATEIEIWTDVDGVMTADPRMVPTAFSLSAISYEEAMEISHFGAKVIYPPTLQPAFRKNIPLRIRNTFNADFPGTLISKETIHDEHPVKGISSIRNISLLSVSGSGMVGVPGVSSRLFGSLARNSINVILITQASSEHTICFAIESKDAPKAKEAIEAEFVTEISTGKIDEVTVEDKAAIVAIIGENMRHMPGIAGAMFTALGKNGVNIMAIAQGSSELNLSIVVEEKNLSKAVNALHEGLFLSNLRTVNVFLLGVGLIGSTLIQQIRKQTEYLLKEQSLHIKVVGMANTRKMIFHPAGLDLALTKDELLANGEKSDLTAFVKRMQDMNLPNCVFVDCTSSQLPIPFYAEILNASISISTPNKQAASGRYRDYISLKKIAAKRGIKFLYETNVGAGLPVINPLNDLKFSGDRIQRIEGILSGTLSFIFNSFKPGTKFSEIVTQAKEKGFTEPDPRDDLNGMDVARKILILAREAGFALEPEDIVVENILPEACVKAGTVDQFLFELEKANGLFDQMLSKATAENKVLRFIARMEHGKATVTLQSVDAQHPFYSLSGSDNIIAVTTDRYLERPLVIKGPGAGAEVTAAGVFAEIISIGNYLGASPISYFHQYK